MRIRDASLFVDVVGHGKPLVLMHGGPGADHWTLVEFRALADEFTLVFYDHRCNGRSEGADLSTMTWENLTADADALRERLGFEQWAVLGHSFGGNVALEYALRYPDRVSHLVLLDTGGDSHWARENAPALLARRGFSPKLVNVARRHLRGQFAPKAFFRNLMRLGRAYDPHITLRQQARGLLLGQWRTKLRPETNIYAGAHLLSNWTVMDRLGEIVAPTLVIAGRDDFIFPPEHQAELAAGIPGARLRIIDRAGHNPYSEQPAATFRAIREFLAAEPAGATVRRGATSGRPREPVGTPG
jgi:proline iminopeptidase